jgi:Uma2 family endonuclease
MASNPKTFLTVEEYLEFERKSDTKHEYFGGEIYAMTGARRAHQQVVSNLVVSLGSQLRTRDCSVYPTDLRVGIPGTSLYAYPDVVVTCGEEKFLDSEFDTLLNPIVLIEVLSDSTEAYDRAGKFENYRAIGSLREYLLISQREMRVEHYVRQGDDGWLYTDTKLADAVVKLPSIDCELSLADVYHKVTFGVRNPGGFMREQPR